MAEPEITYTQRSQQSTYAALLEILRARFPKDYVEIIESTVTQAMLQIFAWTHGQRAYYYDVQARNCYLETANLPESVLALARQLGYKRRMPSAASVKVSLSPIPTQTVQVIIRKGEQIDVGDLTFEASDTYVVPAGAANWPDDASGDLIVFVEGKTYTQTFTSAGTEYQAFQLSQSGTIQGSVTITILDEEWEETDSLIYIEGTGRGRDVFLGTGSDNQSYPLSKLGAIIDDIGASESGFTVLVGNDPWQKVTVFTGAIKEYTATQDTSGVTTITFGTILSGAAPVDESVIDVLYQITGAQKRYTVDFDRSGRATIMFGDGTNGVIPADGATITAEYRVGGGVVGNIPRGNMDGSIRGYLDSGASLNVRITNTEAGSGGAEIESLDSVKSTAPRYAETNKRAVKENDWSVLAQTYRDPRYGTPAYASAKIKQDTPESNEVQVALWSRDSEGRITVASTPLKVGVDNYLRSLNTMCTYPEIIDGGVLYFDIFANVILLSGTTASILEEATRRVRDFFNSTFVAPGEPLSLSSINQQIQNMPEVSASVLTSAQGSNFLSLDLGLGNDVNTTFTGRFVVPDGVVMVPASFQIKAGSTQTISADRSEVLTGDLDDAGTNTISYESGHFFVTFADPPSSTDYITAECRVYAWMMNEMTTSVTADNKINDITEFRNVIERRPFGVGDGLTINTVLPTEFLPYAVNRIFLIGGYDNFGAQSGAQLYAYDDGAGNIVGDVVSGSVNYSTGEINFTWNTLPSPGGTSTYYGRLLAAPDGTTKSFQFEVRTAPGGGGSQVNLDTLGGLGRLKFKFSDLSTPNVAFSDGWDNWQGNIDGLSQDVADTNEIIYEEPSSLYAEGTVSFNSAPEVAAGQDFDIEIAPVTVFLYTAFTAYIPGSPYDRILMADNMGRFYIHPSTAYPFSELDYLSGRYKADIVPGYAGRTVRVTYDTLVKSSAKNIPIDKFVIPTFSNLTLSEVF